MPHGAACGGNCRPMAFRLRGGVNWILRAKCAGYHAPSCARIFCAVAASRSNKTVRACFGGNPFVGLPLGSLINRLKVRAASLCRPTSALTSSHHPLIVRAVIVRQPDRVPASATTCQIVCDAMRRGVLLSASVRRFTVNTADPINDPRIALARERPVFFAGLSTGKILPSSRFMSASNSTANGACSDDEITGANSEKNFTAVSTE